MFCTSWSHHTLTPPKLWGYVPSVTRVMSIGSVAFAFLRRLRGRTG
jgi:hypothetical protein